MNRDSKTVKNNTSDARRQELRDLARFIAVNGVRNNTDLEILHSGTIPSSEKGDYYDVKVVSPSGEIEWGKLSRISNKEMRSLMLSIENAIENTLMFFESLDEEKKKTILEFNKTNRTYDL